MKRLNTFVAAASLLAAVPLAAHAQAKPDDHASHHPTPAAASPTNSAMSEGEVRKVDKEARKITIRHGELKNLDMPPMTMVFRVSDPALVDKVKSGDKVRFVADKQGGQFVVTQIEVKQ